MEAEVQMEQAGMPVGEIPVGGGDIAQIGAPVAAGLRQLDSGQRPVGDPPQQLVLRAEMVQNRHRVDADLRAELAHRETRLAVARQHGESRLQDRIFVEARAVRAAWIWLCVLFSLTILHRSQ